VSITGRRDSVRARAGPVGLNVWGNGGRVAPRCRGRRLIVGDCKGRFERVVSMIAKEPDGSAQQSSETPDVARLKAASEHMEVCPRCGQSFDTRILHQVIYHNQPSHKPIELNG